jgi:aspartyl-tRNA(Asn)/glutamyl-tRNA(Gln) amidotransferase subunit A
MPKPSARATLDQAFLAISDPAGEGARACLTVYRDAASVAAEAADQRAAAGLSLGPLDGLVVTIKDLFDVAGEPTRAASPLRADALPATADAPIVRRLRQAGAVIVAKTNMSEFAFHGIGTNPAFGTPGNAADRSRVPGGSSSGAAVSVADGMCRIAIGSDTGGSVRLPAAFNGLVGFKPTTGRVPTDGAFPLSFTMDSIGPLARSVQDCAAADAVMAGADPAPVMARSPASLRLGVLKGLPFDDCDPIVAAGMEAAFRRLTAAGATLVDIDLSAAFHQVRLIQALGGFSSAEAFFIHREWMDDPVRRGRVDPNVVARIERGRSVTGADYVAMQRRQMALKASLPPLFAGLDGWVLPTVAIVAPTMASVADPAVFGPMNMLALRNTLQINVMDLCAISLPVAGTPLPVGLMLAGPHGGDRALLSVAAGLEPVLAHP